MFKPINSLIIRVVILIIRAYQVVLAPLHKPSCRFQPTCSEYFIEAVSKKGVFAGIITGIWRILRCNPFGGSGYDPVQKLPR